MRSISAAMAAAIVQPVIRPAALIKIAFDSGTVAWWTGFGPISYLGDTYLPTGNLVSISGVKEQSGIKSSGVTIKLSGIKPETVALMQSEPYLGRPCWIYRALLNDQDGFDADLVALRFYGRLDDISGECGKSASFSISVRSRLSDWERERTLRYTDADQQKLYPGDQGMEFIPQLSQRKIIWPRAAFLPDPRD